MSDPKTGEDNLYRQYDAMGSYLSYDPVPVDLGQSQYAYARGNPQKLIDPTGEYVSGIFDRATGSVTFTDVDSGESVTVEGVFSGNRRWANDPGSEGVEDHGPIPGDRHYLVGDGYAAPGHSGDNWWYRLYGFNGSGFDKDCVPVTDPATGQTICRDGFNLHTGLASDGCVTVPSDVSRGLPGYPTSEDYESLKKLLDNTKPLNYKGTTFRGYLYVR